MGGWSKKTETFFDRWDTYGGSLPGFNIDGRAKLGTCIGMFATLLLYTVVIGFSVVSLLKLIGRQNPLITKSVAFDQHGNEAEAIDLQNIDDNFNYQLAFLMRDNYTKEEKSDPKHVRWYANIVESDGQSSNLFQVGLHKCTKTDYDLFYPPSEKFKQAIEFHKKQEGFWCMNETDVNEKPINKRLYGSTESQAHRRIDFVFSPCIPKHKKGHMYSHKDTECLADLKNPKSVEARLKASLEYIGEPDLVILSNKSVVNVLDANQDILENQSELSNQQFESDRPRWVSAHVHKDVVEDESNLIVNLNGQEKEYTTFYNTIGKLEVSSWNNYPVRYKFISYNLFASDTVNLIQRENYSFLDFTGDIGGVIEFFRIFIYTFIYAFGRFRVSSLLANRLYTWISPKGLDVPPGSEDQISQKQKEQIKRNKNNKNTKKQINDKEVLADEIIPIPSFLDLRQARNNWFLCFCQKRWFIKYKKTLDIVDSDIKRNLDLVTLMRRLRMHGIALSFLTAPPLGESKISAQMAQKRSIDFIIQDPSQLPKDLWSRNEGISTKEKIQMRFYTMYSQIDNAQKLKHHQEQIKKSRKKQKLDNWTKLQIQNKSQSHEQLPTVGEINNSEAALDVKSVHVEPKVPSPSRKIRLTKFNESYPGLENDEYDPQRQELSYDDYNNQKRKFNQVNISQKTHLFDQEDFENSDIEFPLNVSKEQVFQPGKNQRKKKQLQNVLSNSNYGKFDPVDLQLQKLQNEENKKLQNSFLKINPDGGKVSLFQKL